MSSESNEVKLVRVPGGITAESIVAALHGNGIPTRMQGEAIGAICGLTMDGLGEVSIFVPEEFFEEAMSILSAGDHGDLLLSESDAVEETEPNGR